MAGQDGFLCHFGGHIKDMFNDAATIEIWDCPALPRGTVVTVPKANFARQSFMTGVRAGDYVEGNVFKTYDLKEPYEFRYVTKII
jgi:hypothetical protein